MKKYSGITLLLLALAGFSGQLAADKLVLVDGQTLEGESI